MSAPLASPSEAREEFGLLARAFAWDVDETRLEELLEPLLLEASDEVRIYSTALVGIYESPTLTTVQSRVIARVEKLLAAAGALKRPRIMKALGIHEPLAMESAAEIAAEAERLRDEALGLLAGLAGSVDTTLPGNTPFARPSFGASTFVPSSTDLSPSERNLLVDETDDLSAWAVPTG